MSHPGLRGQPSVERNAASSQLPAIISFRVLATVSISLEFALWPGQPASGDWARQLHNGLYVLPSMGHLGAMLTPEFTTGLVEASEGLHVHSPSVSEQSFFPFLFFVMLILSIRPQVLSWHLLLKNPKSF